MPQISRLVAEMAEATSVKYNNLVYELKAAGRNIIVMSLGEPYFDVPLFPFDDLPYPDILHYSHSRGILSLRQKLADYFNETYKVKFDPQHEIVITAGSKFAIYMTLASILEPGDEVLYSEPAWVSYPEQIKFCHGVPVGIPFDRSVEDFENYISNRTKAIIVTNPHNPRGYLYSREELSHLLELARKYDLWLLSDEAYSDFVPDGFTSLAQLDPEKRHAIIFNSLSKNFGMSGWRVGYVIANREIIFQTLKVNQHLITCPATILEHYLYRYFDRILAITKPQILDLVRRRSLLEHHMDEIGLSYIPGSGTFYFFVSIAPSRLDSDKFCTQLLYQHNVCVVPGIGYGESCDGFVRVSIGAAPLEDIKKGLASIKSLISVTSGPSK
jgi:aminotransferase